MRRDALQPWPTRPARRLSVLHLHSSRITLARRGEVSKDLEPVYICGIHAGRAAAAEADIRIDLARRTDRSVGELASH